MIQARAGLEGFRIIIAQKVSRPQSSVVLLPPASAIFSFVTIIYLWNDEKLISFPRIFDLRGIHAIRYGYVAFPWDLPRVRQLSSPRYIGPLYSPCRLWHYNPYDTAYTISYRDDRSRNPGGSCTPLVSRVCKIKVTIARRGIISILLSMG